MAIDITPFITPAQQIQIEYGIPTSVTLGQLILESSGKYEGGLSGLAYGFKNLFGIKDTSGTTKPVATTEYINGVPVTVNASFKKYDSYYDSMVDYAKLLQNDRYTKHTSNAKSDLEYITGVWKGGYATDTNYISKVANVIDSYNLRQYNSPNQVTNKPQLNEGGASDILVPSKNNGSATYEYYSPALDTAEKSKEIGLNTQTWEVEGFESTNELTLIQRTAKMITRILSIILLLVLCVVFFLKAFPSVQTNIPFKMKGVK